MTNRILSLTLALGLAGAATAVEQGKYEAAIRENVGVGLGTIIWGNFGDGLISQVCAATTNGTFWNQTFAVTSGTLGAKKADKIARQELREYIRGNMDVVARDVAAGRGESLDAVMDIMAVDAARREEMAGRLQASFGEIYASDTVTHDVVAERMASVLADA
jgi:hypothetical protein